MNLMSFFNEISDPIAKAPDPKPIERIGTNSQFVLDLIKTYGPISDYQMRKHYTRIRSTGGSDASSEVHDAITPRRRELVERGLVRDSGKRYRNPETRKEVIQWELGRDPSLDTVTVTTCTCPNCGHTWEPTK